MSSFATALRTNLEASPKLSRRGERILELLKARPSKMKERRLARMENHARIHLGLPMIGAIDWAKIDWSAIETLVSFLLSILKFLI